MAARVGDNEFMLKLLSDGRAHSTLDIIQASIRERSCGITPHSRASDLRRQGHRIDCERTGTSDGRPVYVYQLAPAETLFEVA